MRGLLLGISLLWAVFASAQFDFDSRVDTNRIRIGEQVALQLTVRDVEEPQKIIWPEQMSQLPPELELVHSAGPDTLFQRGIYSYRLTMYVTSWDTGHWVIPPMSIGYKGQYQQSEAFLISVEDTKLHDSDRLEDIRPIMNEEISFWEWLQANWHFLLIIFCLLLLLGLAYFAYRSWHKRKERLLAARLSLPNNKALHAIEQLRQESAHQDWDKKRFYTALTQIIRTFIEEEFSIPAPELTSTETLIAIRPLAWHVEYVNSLSLLLREGDLVKFAAAHGSDEEALAHMNRCEDFIIGLSNHQEELSTGDE